MQEMYETWIQSLGQEDPLEEDMATHSSVLAWRICTDRGAWWATVHGVSKSCTRLKQLNMQTHIVVKHQILFKMLKEKHFLLIEKKKIVLLQQIEECSGAGGFSERPNC